MSSIDEFFNTEEVTYDALLDEESTTNEVIVYDVVANEIKEISENLDKKEYSETNIKKVIDTGMKALPDMLRVLKDTDDPKMYMSASEFMRTLVDLNKDFSSDSLQSKSSNEIVQNNQNNTTNNVIMMTSTDLLKNI